MRGAERVIAGTWGDTSLEQVARSFERRGPHVRARFLGARVPKPVRYAALWLVLAALSLAALLVPGFPTAAHNPPLAMAVITMSGAVTLTAMLRSLSSCAR